MALLLRTPSFVKRAKTMDVGLKECELEERNVIIAYIVYKQLQWAVGWMEPGPSI